MSHPRPGGSSMMKGGPPWRKTPACTLAVCGGGEACVTFSPEGGRAVYFSWMSSSTSKACEAARRRTKNDAATTAAVSGMRIGRLTLRYALECAGADDVREVHVQLGDQDQEGEDGQDQREPGHGLQAKSPLKSAICDRDTCRRLRPDLEALPTVSELAVMIRTPFLGAGSAGTDQDPNRCWCVHRAGRVYLVSRRSQDDLVTSRSRSVQEHPLRIDHLAQDAQLLRRRRGRLGRALRRPAESRCPRPRPAGVRPGW